MPWQNTIVIDTIVSREIVLREIQQHVYKCHYVWTQGEQQTEHLGSRQVGMEALERLQSVHTTLGLMRSHSLCSSGNDGSTLLGGLAADRFVADFFIFLGKTSANEEELNERCGILMSTLPKVSITFLQALVAENFTLGGGGQDAVKVPNTGCSKVGKSSKVPSPPRAGHAYTRYDEKDSTMLFTSENVHGYELLTRNSPSQGKSEERPLATLLSPVVGLKAMERASTTLEDFCRSYFMFHNMDVHNPQLLFKYLPILSFVEAFIYQLDEENEEQVRVQYSGCEACLFNSSNQDSQGSGHYVLDGSCQNAARSKTWCAKQDCVRDSSRKNSLGTHLFRGLEHSLADKGLLTERIISEFRDGLEYWRLEYALCKAIITDDHISPEDIFTAIKLKSFDYRVLNLLLHSLIGREVNEAHFKFLAVSELLVEIADDLFDYEDDVLKNSFNVLRMLVKVYGPAKAPEILAKFVSEQEVTYQQLLDALEPGLARHYRERCKEATHEGGGGSKYQFGSWVIPPVIMDEEAFRGMHSASPP